MSERSPRVAVEAAWEERIARARQLADERSPAAEILTFYAALADCQQSLLSGSSGPRNRARNFVDAVDLDSAVAAVPGFLDWLERAAPPQLARPATGADRRTRVDWHDLMRERLAGDHPDAEEADIVRTFVVEAVLQPFAEEAATARRDAPSSRRPDSTRLSALGVRCPMCGGLPAVASLREEGQGSKRTLACALCLTEWDFVRVRCASCGEERSDAQPIFTADAALPHARIDACDTCQTYVKTIDLTKNGLAVPLVDDLASVPLDLWARERGYRRLRANLLRL